MRFLMTAGRPASSLLEKTGVINISNQNDPRGSLLLEMALEAKRLVALVQESLVDRAMRRMTNHASLAHRFVLIYPRPPLRAMTLETGVVLA